MKGAAERPAVTVVIVNWNGRRWLEQCLPTLARQTFRDFETIVVDNGSQDDSVTWLEQHWPQVRVLALPDNRGYAGANNLGIELARGVWIATLNNDTLLDPGWLANLMAATSDPGVGMVASLVVCWDAPERVDAAGILVDQSGLAWNRGHGQPAAGFSQAAEVFGPNGAAGLYRAEMLAQIGAFDSDFFAYYEDVDLAWRAQRAGWRCRYAPAAVVRHWHSATGARDPYLKTYLISRNKLWTICKNYDRRALLWWLPLIVIFDWLGLFYRLFSERNLAALKGRLAALGGIRRMWSRQRPGSSPTLAKPGWPGRSRRG